LHSNASWGAVEPFDQRRSQHGNAAAVEAIGQRGGDVLVRMRDKAWRRLDQSNPGTEVGQDRGELATGNGDVHLRGIAPQAKLPPGLGVTHQASGAGQSTDRSRPLIQAGTAHSLGLDQRHVGAKLTGLQRRSGPGGSAAKHKYSHHRALCGGRRHRGIIPKG
jgi:hypothetical protein